MSNDSLEEALRRELAEIQGAADALVDYPLLNRQRHSGLQRSAWGVVLALVVVSSVILLNGIADNADRVGVVASQPERDATVEPATMLEPHETTPETEDIDNVENSVAGTAWNILSAETGEITGTLSLFSGGHYIYDSSHYVACGNNGAYTIRQNTLTIAATAQDSIGGCPTGPGRVKFGSRFDIINGALVLPNDTSGVILVRVEGSIGDAPGWLVDQNERIAGIDTSGG